MTPPLAKAAYWALSAIFYRGIFPLISFFWLGPSKGIRNIPSNGAFIIAANHASHLDPPLISHFFSSKAGIKVHGLPKKELFGIPVFGTLLRLNGHIPVDREKGGNSALCEAIDALKGGKAILLFPEGTRTSTGKMGEGKTGAVRLSLLSGAPILPVRIDGTFDILPRGAFFPRTLRKAGLAIGRPWKPKIPPHLTKTALRSLTSHLMRTIEKLR